MARKLLQTKKTTLTYGISDISTTIQLKNLLKLDGTAVSASDIGDILYGTFGPGTSKEEIFSINGANATVETNGNVTITGIVRGLKEVSPYDTGGFATDHASGEVVIFGNNPQLYQDIYDYIDDAVVGGGVNASTTVKGISKLSVAPASPTDPIAVGTNDPRIPTTDFTEAMAGTLGTPSATNKFATSDNVYTGETDQEQTTQNASVEFGMPNTSTNKNKITQSFIPVKTKIRGVKLYKIANTGTFTGTVTVELFADSAGSPTGSALATKTFTNIEYNTLEVGGFEVLFSSEYSMTTGSTYHLVISASTADGSNHPNIGTNSAGGYANGSVKYWNGTDGYVAVATIDLYFKTLNGENSQIVQTDSTGSIPLSMFDISKMPIPFLPQSIIVSHTSVDYMEMCPSNGGDGSVLIYLARSSTTLKIYRLARDAGQLTYYITHQTSISSVDADQTYCLIVGNYVYVPWYDNPTPRMKRYDLADLGNVTDMTISGTGYFSGSGFTDGTNLYLYAGSSDTFAKFTISGTTATNAGNITYTGAGAVTTAMCNNGYVYTALTVTDDSNDLTFKKYSLLGGSMISSLVLKIKQYRTSFFSAGSGKIGLSYSRPVDDVASPDTGNEVFIKAITAF